MLSVVVNGLFGRDVPGLCLVVAAGVEVAREQREGGRSHLDPQPVPGRERDPGLPQVEPVFVDPPLFQQLGLLGRTPEPRADLPGGEPNSFPSLSTS